MHVQIVRFKLRSGARREAFLELTEKMTAWLTNRNGFLAYELYEDSEWWSDRIARESRECAQEGLDEFLATKIAEEMISLVESDYTSFFGEMVVSV